MRAEDILYSAWHRGIRDRVLEKLSAYNHLNVEQTAKTEKAYQAIMEEAIKLGELETQKWDSSMLSSTTYNFNEEILTVEFKNGVEYSYQNINKEEYKKFLDSESKGKHFISEIRDKKEYKRL